MEPVTSNDRPAFSLFELNNLIKNTISSVLPDAYWLIAEIAEMKPNQKGHCYLDLVEKDNGRVIAQIKATIWAYDFRRLSAVFQTATGESLRSGMKVLLQVIVNFHEVYGLSLNVRDLDPAYTMGEMALKKKEVIERLTKEGLIGLNKTLSLPLVPQRIAVISSPTAAGYGDFFEHLDRNPYGYSFSHVLFPALMQGVGAEDSIIGAIRRVALKKDLFDLLVIIRGGGSAIDLHCFDSYSLAAEVARMPLPVITGIGHERDDTVVDMTAHTKMKTPTAVAEFLISGLSSFEENVVGIQHRLITRSEQLLRDQYSSVESLTRRLGLMSTRLTGSFKSGLDVIDNDLRTLVARFFSGNAAQLETLEKVVRLLDPVNVLKRGYSITQHRGRVITNGKALRPGDILDTILFEGNIKSYVAKTPREAKTSEQEQAVDLFSGIEGA